MSGFLTRRGNTWHFVRRVPAEFSGLDRRGIIRHSTRVKIADDRIGRRAARVAHNLNQELERFWKDLAGGQSKADINRYDEARRRARSLGYDYVPNGGLIALSQEKRLEWLESLVIKGLTNNPGAREGQSNPESPRHIPEFGAWLTRRCPKHRLQRHTADGTRTCSWLSHLGMHWTSVDRAVV